MFAAGFGLDPPVDSVVSDEVSDQFYHEWESVSGHRHSQSIPRGPLVGITRHEDNAHTKDDGGDQDAQESLRG